MNGAEAQINTIQYSGLKANRKHSWKTIPRH